MNVEKLVGELRRREENLFMGTATPSGWEGARKVFDRDQADYFVVEIRPPDDQDTQVFILASQQFLSGDMMRITSKGRGTKVSRKLTAEEAVGWLESIARTARAEKYRVFVSPRWGQLVIVVDTEKRDS